MLTTRDGPAVTDAKPDISRKSRFLPQLGRPRRNIAMTFGVEKLEWCGDGEKV